MTKENTMDTPDQRRADDDRQRRDIRLASLDEWELENEDQDLRGRLLLTPEGQEIARIDDMLVDRERERISALRLSDERLVDIDYVDIREGRPVLLVPDRGIPATPAGVDHDNLTAEHIPIVEEHLSVGKRQVDLGGVRVRSRVVTQHEAKDVDLREERVDVKREPRDEPVDPAEADALFEDRTIEVRETAERPVVAKEARVTGEVVVDKKAKSRKEHVEDEVRRTEVDVDRDPGKSRR